MGFVQTIVRREPWDVHPRLAELGTSLEALLRIRSVARSEAANATPFHCANAAGTFAYQHGVFELRNQHVGEDWRAESLYGVETIVNDRLKVRIAFSNVGVACSDQILPKPRSRKGSGAEQVCEANLFGDLPHYAPLPADGIPTFYVMVDDDGAIELSQPIVSGDTFSAYVERVFVSRGGEDALGVSLPLDEDDAVTGFDPQVARK